MEKLFSLEYGIGGLCVLLTIMILIKAAEVILRMKEKKESLSETAIVDLTKAVNDNTMVLNLLEVRFRAIENTTTDFPKFKKDLTRFYSAIKQMAGEDWPYIRDEIMKDEFQS